MILKLASLSPLAVMNKKNGEKAMTFAEYQAMVLDLDSKEIPVLEETSKKSINIKTDVKINA